VGKPQESPKFKSVSISTPLHNKAKQFVKDHPEYRSLPEFLCESVRLRMEALSRPFGEEQEIWINEVVARELAKWKEAKP
jgi:hypothetical protein